VFTIHRYGSPINGLAVSERLNLLAVATYGEVGLWDRKANRQLPSLRIRATKALAFSPTENLLAAGTWNEKGRPVVELWEVILGKATKRFTLEVGNRSLSFSPDGKLLAVFDSDQHQFTITDCASGRVSARYAVQPLRDKAAGWVLFSPDGNQVAIGEEYGRIQLFSIRTETFVRLKTETGCDFSAAAFSPDSEWLAAGMGYGDGTIRLWHIRSGELRGQFAKHSDNVNALAFAPDGKQLVSASEDGTIRIWSVADGTEVRCLQSSGEGLTALALLADGQTLISGDAGGSVCVWDPTRSRPPVYTNLAVGLPLEALSEVPPLGFAHATLDPRAVRHFGIAFMPDSRSFITTDSEGSLARWDARSFQLLEKLSAMGSNHWGVALSPDGHWLATGDPPDRITVWDWPNRRAVADFAVHLEWFGLLRFSRSGQYLTAAGFRNDPGTTVKVWRTADWEEVLLTGGQFESLWSVDISADDRLLAAGYANGAVRLFRWPSREPEATFTQEHSTVPAVVFSADGGRLHSVGLDGTVRVWDVLTRRQLAKLQGHANQVLGAALFPDAPRLVTGGVTARDAVKLWDLAAERELLSLQGEGHYFMYVACSPDGNTLAATSFSGIAHFWHVPSWEEIEEAEKRQAAPSP